MKSNDAPQKQTIRQILDSGAVLEALRAGSKQAARINKLLGYPVATCQGDKVIWIPPEEIQVDDEGQPDRKTKGLGA